MRLGFLLLTLLFLTACSQAPVNDYDREPASLDEELVFGDADPKKSTAKVFPPSGREDELRHYFYLELRDAKGKLVDCDPKELGLKNSKGKSVRFRVDRSAKGKYYLTVLDKSGSPELKLKVYIGSVRLDQEVRLVMKRPDRHKSWLKAVRSEQSGYRLKLFLADDQGRPVNVPFVPEIIVEGQAFVDNLEKVGDGTWEFDLSYSNYNQIVYVSVRAHGIYMADMFRLQHMEK